MSRRTRLDLDEWLFEGDRAVKFFIGWFIFWAVVGLALLGGAVWLVHTLLVHFAVI